MDKLTDFPAVAVQVGAGDALPTGAAKWTAREWFDRVMIVVAGFVLGTIAAFVIAVFAGWIEFFLC